MPTADQLRQYPLFAGLSDEELAGIAPCIIKRAFAKGAYLFHPGSPGLSLYLIESGWVRSFFADVRGREYFLNYSGPRSVVGLPLLAEDQERLYGAAAYQETVALILGREDVFDFMKRSHPFMQNMFREMVNIIRRIGLYAQAHTILQLDGRLASLLIYMAMYGPSAGTNEIEITLTQAEIASWAGVSRGRTNQSLNKMQRRNLIRLNGHKIILLDLPGLAKMAEGLLTYSV
jgi:CRP/FNR family transcriptional regulator, cyclic AMP receptor protein